MNNLELNSEMVCSFLFFFGEELFSKALSQSLRLLLLKRANLAPTFSKKLSYSLETLFLFRLQLE